jgi:hypothetical protein
MIICDYTFNLCTNGSELVFVSLFDKIFIVDHAAAFLKSKFDSTYSIHLNGIISQDEFRESIDQINHRISIRTTAISLNTIFVLIAMVGMVCYFTGYIRAHDSGTYGIPPIMGAGIGLIIFKVIFVIVGVIIIIPRRRARMR